MPGFGYQRFLPDGDPTQGADHLNFHLDGNQGTIGLFLPDLTPIDCVVYQAQRANVAQGRSPNGSTSITAGTRILEVHCSRQARSRSAALYGNLDKPSAGY